MILRMLTILLIACAGSLSLTAQNSAGSSVTSEFQRYVSAAERACLTIANAMPEDRYSFVPTNGEFKGVRSFALLVKHVAVDNYLTGAALLGEKPPIDPGLHENGPDSIQDKAQIMKFLRESFIYLHRATNRVNQKNLMEKIEYFGGARVTRLAVITSAVSHPMDIYGQMVEYLRMNGTDPQSVPAWKETT